MESEGITRRPKKKLKKTVGSKKLCSWITADLDTDEIFKNATIDGFLGMDVPTIFTFLSL